jgi:beta-phosphoglucomutase
MRYAVIFDLDGVLVDTYQAHFDSWQILCHQWELTMTEPQFAATFGRTTREVVAEFWSAREFSPAEVEAIDIRKEALFRDRLRRDFPVMDGAVELIDDLHQSGVALAIGSSAPPDNVWLSLDLLNRRDTFASVVTGADVTFGKPDPQVFLRAAEQLRVAPRSCVVIEDAPAGVSAALAAEMKCVALASPGRTREELTAAHRVIDSLLEVSASSLIQLIRHAPA